MNVLPVYFFPEPFCDPAILNPEAGRNHNLTDLFDSLSITMWIKGMKNKILLRMDIVLARSYGIKNYFNQPFNLPKFHVFHPFFLDTMFGDNDMDIRPDSRCSQLLGGATV